MTNIIFMKFIDSPLIILLDPKWSIWQLPHSLYDVSIYLFDLIYIYISLLAVHFEQAKEEERESKVRVSQTRKG